VERVRSDDEEQEDGRVQTDVEGRAPGCRGETERDESSGPPAFK